MKRMRLDIRDWEAFTTLIRLRHFGRAAEELGITQSAMSQRISKLEADLQFKLFVRSNQGVEATPEGIAIVPEAQSLIAAKRNILETAAYLHENTARPIRLLLSNAVIHSAVLPKLRQALENKFQSHFYVDVEAADEIEPRLQSAEHDLAITTLPIARDGFEERVLAELPMAVAVPENLDERSISIEALCQQPLLTMSRDTEPHLYDKLITEATRARQSLQIGQPVVSFPSILAMVSMGKGWGIVPLAMAGAVPIGIKVLPLDMAFAPTIRVLAVWASDNKRASQTAETLLKCRPFD